MLKRINLLLLCCLFVSSSHAQQVRFWEFDEKHPLYSETALDIEVGPKGFVWMATDGGLLRYDGAKIRRYLKNTGAAHQLPSNILKSIEWDQQGILWIGTMSHGLVRFDPLTQQFTLIPLLDETTHHIREIHVDQFERLWVGTDNGQLYVVDTKSNHVTPIPIDNPQKHSIVAFASDSQGHVWVGIQGYGIAVYDSDLQLRNHFKSTEPATGLASDKIRTLFRDNNNRVWIGTRGSGALYFDDETATFQRPNMPSELAELFDSSEVLAIEQDASGDIWFSSWGKGLFRLSNHDQSFQRFYRKPEQTMSLPENIVITMKSLPDGTLFLSGYYTGFASYTPQNKQFKRFSYEKTAGALSSNSTKAFVEETDGSGTWVGTYKGGLNYYDRQTNSFSQFQNDPNNPNSLSNNSVWSLAIDKSDVLWVGTSGGVNRFNRQQQTFERHEKDQSDPNSLQGDTVFSMSVDSTNRLWLGLWYGGLALYRPETNDFQNFRHEPERLDSLPANNVKCIYEDKQSRIWVCTTNGFALKANNQDSFKIYTIDPESEVTLPSNSINSLFQDSNDNFWVATAEGVRLFDPNSGTFKLPNIGPLLSATVFGVKEDSDNKLWFATSIGVYRFDPEGEKLEYFSQEDGLQGETVQIGSFYFNGKNRLYVGSGSGYTEFDPVAIEKISYQAPIVLTDYYLFNKIMTPQDEGFVADISSQNPLNLSYEDYLFSIEFASLSFGPQQKRPIEYRLDKFDNRWLDPPNKISKAIFTNVPAGSYQLRVRYKSQPFATFDSNAELQIPLIVHPPWWQTLWARAIFVLLLITLLTVFYKYRVRILKHRQIELEETVAERTASLEKSNKMLAESLKQIEAMAKTDELTQLPNRRATTEFLSREFLVAQRQQQPLSLAIADIDFFKQINDRFGHDGGDAALIHVANTLKESLRVTDFVGRWGGEEFVFVLPNTSAENAVTVLEKVRKTLADSAFDYLGEKVKITVSVGFTQVTDSVDTALSRADTVLYECKKSGRNCVLVA